MNIEQRSRIRFTPSRWIGLSCLIVLCFWAPSVWAQAQVPESQLQIFHMQHVSAEQAVQTMAQMMVGEKDLRLSVDNRKNAVLAIGAPESMRRVAEVVKVLDQPADSPESTTQLYRASNDASFFARYRKLISELADQNDVQAAVEPNLGMAILKGQPQKLKSLAKLLDTVQEMSSEMDKAAKQEQLDESRNMRVLVQWLTNHDQGDSKAPDPALESLMKPLAQFGIQGMTVKSQWVVSCRGNDPGEAAGKVARENEEATVMVKVARDAEKKEDFSVEFRIESGKSGSLASVQGIVRLSGTDPVLLSVTPFFGSDSAVVVRRLPE